MKICSGCKTEKSLDEFYQRGTRFTNPCKECSIKRANARQKANLPEILKARNEKADYFRKYKLDRKLKVRAWLKDLKESTPCADCMGQFPSECMDFDHRDPSKKVRGVAAMIGAAQNLETIKAEIAKCDLVCANCHRIRTAKQLGWH